MKKFSGLAFLLVSAVLLFSCSNNAAYGKNGSIRLGLGSSKARITNGGFYEENEAKEYEISLKGKTELTKKYSSEQMNKGIILDDLIPGEYTVSVNAYGYEGGYIGEPAAGASEDKPMIVIASGSANVFVNSGFTAHVKVPLKAKKFEKEETYYMQINWSPDEENYFISAEALLNSEKKVEIDKSKFWCSIMDGKGNPVETLEESAIEYEVPTCEIDGEVYPYIGVVPVKIKTNYKGKEITGELSIRFVHTIDKLNSIEIQYSLGNDYDFFTVPVENGISVTSGTKVYFKAIPNEPKYVYYGDNGKTILSETIACIWSETKNNSEIANHMAKISNLSIDKVSAIKLSCFPSLIDFSDETKNFSEEIKALSEEIKTFIDNSNSKIEGYLQTDIEFNVSLKS